MKIVEPFIITDDCMLWFMSDLHYNHANVIRFNERPFENVYRMNKHIEETLKTTPKKGDIIFDLGDLFWKGVSETEMKRIISEIPKQRIYKIMGNHDNYNVYKKSYVGTLFSLISDILEINVDYQGKIYKLVLSHYPLLSWRDKSRGSWMIAGHTHGALDSYNKESGDLRVDIGFDSEIAKNTGNFMISFPDLIKHFEKKTED